MHYSRMYVVSFASAQDFSRSSCTSSLIRAGRAGLGWAGQGRAGLGRAGLGRAADLVQLHQRSFVAEVCFLSAAYLSPNKPAEVTALLLQH